MDAVFADIQKNAAINGFRRGHAPMEFVRKEFAQTALEKTKRNLMQFSAEKIIKEKNLQPVVTPVVEPAEYLQGTEKPFLFKSLSSNSDMNLE